MSEVHWLYEYINAGNYKGKVERPKVSRTIEDIEKPKSRFLIWPLLAIFHYRLFRFHVSNLVDVKFV